MLKGRMFKLVAVIVMIATALSITGVSATSASAATLYHVCVVTGTSPPWCIDATPHNDIYQISTDQTRAAVGFLGPYHIPGDSTNWWELTTGNNLCLDYDPINGYVYAESCQPTDSQEWWDNHPGLQFENAYGNFTYGYDTWLVPLGGAQTPHTSDLILSGSPTAPLQWSESALP